MDSETIAAALQAAYEHAPEARPIPAAGQPVNVLPVRCQQVRVIGGPEGRWVLGLGFGELALFAELPPRSLAKLHADLGALLAHMPPAPDRAQ